MINLHLIVLIASKTDNCCREYVKSAGVGWT